MFECLVFVKLAKVLYHLGHFPLFGYIKCILECFPGSTSQLAFLLTSHLSSEHIEQALQSCLCACNLKIEFLKLDIFEFKGLLLYLLDHFMKWIHFSFDYLLNLLLIALEIVNDLFNVFVWNQVPRFDVVRADRLVNNHFLLVVFHADCYTDSRLLTRRLFGFGYCLFF